MSRTADDRRKLQDEADVAAAAQDFARALQLLEQAVDGQEASAELWTKLSAMRRAAGNLPGALKAIERALALSPLDFSALLSRAMLLERLGDVRAGEAFVRSLAHAPADERIPAAMASAVAHARQRAAKHQADVEARLNSAIPAGLDRSERSRVERFVSNSSRRTRHFHQEPTDFHYPGLPEIEVHDREEFPELGILESATPAIHREFEALIAAEAAEMVPYIQYPEHVPLAQWRELNGNRDWTAIHLLQNGSRVEANARHCPKTMETIAKLPQPNVPGASPNAMFSLLAPKTRIPPHTGVANMRLVCHLPLIVPPNCGFRVGATTREWNVGEAFVFDDTIEHEAWNESNELRVVLILDLWAPALSPAERIAVARVIAAAGVDFGSG
ncbi:MAG TPA: aspartyl/asparaginyl beta-hydroxylase domain-containing protein [Sphingomicrobium sp.]|jgi:aspartyl/asparaginyl beta-hydroxylase (cupin superfamily)|nr:aspartyl/asparaginyl beta-hydroxylase domain-containing protein [Sphingomicrobium sp.]